MGVGSPFSPRLVFRWLLLGSVCSLVSELRSTWQGEMVKSRRLWLPGALFSRGGGCAGPEWHAPYPCESKVEPLPRGSLEGLGYEAYFQKSPDEGNEMRFHFPELKCRVGVWGLEQTQDHSQVK